MARVPLSFDIDRSPATEPELTKAAAEIERTQVGARIPAQLYRQLKSRAALQGETVQTLVEEAIARYLE
jgi:predicted DNA binding CopG/RHH family protein